MNKKSFALYLEKMTLFSTSFLFVDNYRAYGINRKGEFYEYHTIIKNIEVYHGHYLRKKIYEAV